MTPTEDLFERLFSIKARGSTVRTELSAGLTTFMTMAYIIFVNPSIMADAGMPFDAAIAATIYASVLGNLAMAVWVNYPVALAPGMGLNAFFAYYVCGTAGLHWTEALGAVFISGIVFFLLTVTHVRTLFFQAVPSVIRHALVVGVGFFIALIGLKNAGLVVDDAANLIGPGNFTSPSVLLSCFGILVICALMARGVHSAVLAGILLTTILAMLCGVTAPPEGPSSFVRLDVPDISPVLMQLDIMGALHYGIISIILTFTIVEIFDNMDALIALTSRAHLAEKDSSGRIPGLERALTTDSAGTIVSSFLGTSTITTYIESAAGISRGGRTGLTVLVVSVLFALSLFLTPMIALVPACATAPALVVVGGGMLSSIRNIDFDDCTELFPAFLTIIMMPMTSSVACGFGSGFISYVLLKTLAGRAREVRLCTWVIAALFAVSFAMRV